MKSQKRREDKGLGRLGRLVFIESFSKYFKIVISFDQHTKLVAPLMSNSLGMPKRLRIERQHFSMTETLPHPTPNLSMSDGTAYLESLEDCCSCSRHLWGLLKDCHFKM